MPNRAPVHRAPGVRPKPEQTRQYDARRGSAHSRGYDRAWTRLRNHFLAEHPLCRMCEEEGRVAAASEVDHRVPIAIDPSRRLEWDNLDALCHEHHAVKTAEDARRYGGGQAPP